MLARMLVLMALIASLTAAPAAGSSAAPLAADGQTWTQVRLAAAFWDKRQVHGCATPVMSVQRLPATTAEIATGGCALILNSEFHRSARVGRGVSRILAAVIECTAVVHGLGHERGLPHTESGVMAEHFEYEHAPYDCWQFAESLAKPRAARYVAKFRATLRR